MRVHLLAFGQLKDLLEDNLVELPPHAVVADLVAQLQLNIPAIAALLPSCAVSVNAAYATADQPLQDEDVVGILPPVSGGSGTGPGAGVVITCLTREPVDAASLIASVKQGSDGAVVVFDGIVRNNTRGRSTLYLEYEAYEEMAEKQIRQLAHDAVARFGVRAVTLVHRLGHLQIGETSVLIIVAAAHRGVAFDASRWLIDTLKQTVPIWKREIFVDGAVWAAGEPFPAELMPGGMSSGDTA